MPKIDYNIDMEENRPQEQLKKFNFFVAEQKVERIVDPKSHPIRLTDLRVTDTIQVKSKYININREFCCFKNNEIEFLFLETALKLNGILILRLLGN